MSDADKWDTDRSLAGRIDIFEKIQGDTILRIQASLQPSHPYNALIGRVASEWTHFEHMLDEIIWNLAEIPEELALCITGHIMGATPRFKMIESLGAYRGISSELLKKARKLKNEQYETGEHRNRIVHDPWFVVKIKGLEQQTTQLKTTGHMAITPTEIETTITEIRKLITAVAELSGEVLNLLGIWRGASFADVNQQTGFGEPGKGAPHGDQTTCFAAYA